MVVSTVAVVAVVVTGGAAAPALGAAATAGTGVISTAVGTTAATAATVAGSAAGGAAASAIAGAVAGGTAASAAGGAVVGSAAAVGISSSSAGAAGLAAGVLSGPVGWLLLGTESTPWQEGYTFDCWKPVLHDETMEPSTGMLLRDVLMDSRIQNVSLNGDPLVPNIVLENIWRERFAIQYITLARTNNVALHALRLDDPYDNLPLC